MKETEKLRVLIPHWIEHNKEHAAEYREWAERAGEAGAEIILAADTMLQANTSLEGALEKLGGPLDYTHSH